jgi:hypothetical protein
VAQSAVSSQPSIGSTETLLFDLEGDPVPPKLFLAPAKDGGAPLGDGGVGGAVAPSASSPSKLAGGQRMRRRQGSSAASRALSSEAGGGCRTGCGSVGGLIQQQCCTPEPGRPVCGGLGRRRCQGRQHVACGCRPRRAAAAAAAARRRQPSSKWQLRVTAL